MSCLDCPLLSPLALSFSQLFHFRGSLTLQLPSGTLLRLSAWITILFAATCKRWYKLFWIQQNPCRTDTEGDLTLNV